MLCWLCLHSGKRHLPHRPPVAAGRRLPIRMALSLTEMEAAAFGALEKEAHLDEKLGAGVGAKKERAVIQAAVQAYEGALAANEAAALTREDAEAAEDAGEDAAPPPERTLYHVATDHIAVFGGDPARRKDKVSKLMQPYASLALFGTPRDVGEGDQKRLVSQIRNGKLDVVYCWTRFSNHGSRHAIRQACVAMPEVKFVEVGSLSVMNNCWSGAREAGATEADDEG